MELRRNNSVSVHFLYQPFNSSYSTDPFFPFPNLQSFSVWRPLFGNRLLFHCSRASPFLLPPLRRIVSKEGVFPLSIPIMTPHHTQQLPATTTSITGERIRLPPQAECPALTSSVPLSNSPFLLDDFGDSTRQQSNSLPRNATH